MTRKGSLITFPSSAEIADSASSFVAKETNPYPADFPDGSPNTTLAETGLKLAEKNSRRLLDLTFHARLDTYSLWRVSTGGVLTVTVRIGFLNLLENCTLIILPVNSCQIYYWQEDQNIDTFFIATWKSREVLFLWMWSRKFSCNF